MLQEAQQALDHVEGLFLFTVSRDESFALVGDPQPSLIREVRSRV